VQLRTLCATTSRDARPNGPRDPKRPSIRRPGTITEAPAFGHAWVCKTRPARRSANGPPATD